MKCVTVDGIKVTAGAFGIALVFAECSLDGHGAAEIVLQTNGNEGGEGRGKRKHTHHRQPNGEAQTRALKLDSQWLSPERRGTVPRKTPISVSLATISVLIRNNRISAVKAGHLALGPAPLRINLLC